MKKVLYITFLCTLGILVYHEVKNNMLNQTSSRYIPTARFLSQVKRENAKENNRKVAYLTFDDGPSDVTEIVLDVCDEKKVKATFFLVGEEITKEREKYVKREAKEGHAIGIHAFNHSRDDLYGNYTKFVEDIEMAKKKIEEVAGQKVYIHRFPWGSNNTYLKGMNKKVRKKMKEMNLRSYDWNCSGEDAIGHASEEMIYARIKKDMKGKKKLVILLHDYCGCKKTAHVLGRVIDMIRENGYEFDTLDHAEELLFSDLYGKKK